MRTVNYVSEKESLTANLAFVQRRVRDAGIHEEKKEVRLTVSRGVPSQRHVTTSPLDSDLADGIVVGLSLGAGSGWRTR
jgi:hypothetical protein